MYALRIYCSNKQQTRHTNKVVGLFEQKDKTKHVYHYSDKGKIDWSLSRLRIWPANDKKSTVYPLPEGQRLFLFAKVIGKDKINLLSSVFEPDDYISFEPCDLKDPCDELFYLIVAADEEEARIKLSTL